MEGKADDFERQGSLTRRIKSLLPYKHHHQKAQVTADGLLQRSQSFLEGVVTGDDPVTSPGPKRKMSRSQSLRNVALNISMRMRKSKKSSTGAAGVAATSATLQDVSLSAPTSPAAAHAQAPNFAWPTPPPAEAPPTGAAAAAVVKGGEDDETQLLQQQLQQETPPHPAASATSPGDERQWPPLPDPPRGSKSGSLFRSSSFSSLLHWGHKSGSGRSRRAALSRGSISSSSISSLGAPGGPGAVFPEGRGGWERSDDGKQATSDVAHVSKDDGGEAATAPRSGGEFWNKGGDSVAAVGGAAAPAGKFSKRNGEVKGRPCTPLGGSCERLVRRNRGSHLLAPCQRCSIVRPWSLDVTALVEEDEEQAGAGKEDLEGRSRSLTHIDSLDPSMLVKAAAAVACNKGGGGPADPDDPTMPLLLDGGAGGGGILGPSKRLSGSAELPAPNDRLYVPGGGRNGSQDSKMRRQKLTRSQVSSSEYFSVSFECLEDPGPEEFVPATKGTTLAEALSHVCQKRGIDLSTVCIYQESAKKPISIYSTDASRLGGKHLRIKAKEERSPSRSFKGTSSQGHSRKTSGSYKGYKAGKFFSASTEEANYASLTEGGSGHLDLKAPPPQAPSKAPSRQRWSAIFGNNKDTRMGTLAETLDNYSKNGIPAAYRGDGPSAKAAKGDGRSADDALDDEEEDLLFLEDDWREVVGGDALAAQLTERETQHQNAIWELLTTEAAYIRTLKVVTDLFLACLLSLQASTGILTEVDTECLFSNIREIHAANLTFWRRHLLPMVQEARRWREGLAANPLHPRPLDPKDMMEGFLKFGEIFHPYTEYCGDQSRCQHYCREKIQENEHFAAYLAWCETRKECNRLRLQDILVKPMQRLTKYSLLLKAIQRHSEDAADIESLDHMIKSVDEFVNGVNSTLRQRQEQERLRGVIARIEAYDVVETKDDETERMVRQYSELDLTCQMPGCRPHQRRHLLMEADVRLRDQATSKVDVHVFLFTDILLVCKAVGGSRRAKGDVGSVGGVGGEGVGTDGGPGGLVSGGVTPVGSSSDLRMLKVIRQPFVVDRLEVKLAPAGNALSCVYLNELRMATAAFTLSASEPKTTKTLHENLQRARSQYDRAKKKARTEDMEEVLASLQQQTQPPQPPSRHAPKLSALTSPYDSAGSTCCLCFYEDSPHGSAAGGGGGSYAGGVGGGGGLSGYGGGDSAFGGLVPSCPRSPRCSSSRGSRLSSLAHSHSGSMEMALEAGMAGGGGGGGGGGLSSGGCSSACQSRGVSVETMTDLRGSSLSSDEGSSAAGTSAAAHSDSGTSLGSGGGPGAPSPASSLASVAPPAILHHFHSHAHHGGRAPAGQQQQQTNLSNSSSAQQQQGMQAVAAPGLHQPVAPLQPPSPRAERRGFLSRSPTPNTLSVTAMPYGSSSSPSPSASTSPGATSGGGGGGALGAMYLGGQSLPNLSAVASGRYSGHSLQQQQPPTSSSGAVAYLLPPSRSPPPPPINQRGISYPPPSPPRSLRRSHAVVHLPGGGRGAGGHHHPPLTKTRHVGSLLGPPPPQFSTEAPDGTTMQPSDLGVPVIGGVLPPSNEGSGEDAALLQEREDSGVVCGEGSGSEVMDACAPPPWATPEGQQTTAETAAEEGGERTSGSGATPLESLAAPSGDVAEAGRVGGSGLCTCSAIQFREIGVNESSDTPREQRDQSSIQGRTDASDGNSTTSSHGNDATCPVHGSCTDSSCC